MPLYPAVRVSGGAVAEDFGYAAWTFDFSLAVSNIPLATAGTVYTSRLYVPRPCVATNLHCLLAVVGATLTADQCLAGLYNSAGALLSSTADQSVAWVSLGHKTMALAVAQPLTVGFYDVAFFFNGTTGPGIARVANQNTINGNTSTTGLRFATCDTGRTTSLPATLGAKTTNTAVGMWTAIS